MQQPNSLSKSVVQGAGRTSSSEEENAKPEKQSVLLACYGTLRLGHGNYSYLLSGDQSEHIGTTKTPAEYTMYGKRSGFPIVVDKGNTPIVVDIFRVTNETVLKRVHQLEGCTGVPGHKDNWYDIKEVETPLGKAWMYIQHKDFNPENVITSGDWENR